MKTYNETGPCIELRRGEVARRAMELWIAAGQPAGQDLVFWLQAEVELLNQRLGRGIARARRILLPRPKRRHSCPQPIPRTGAPRANTKTFGQPAVAADRNVRAPLAEAA